MVKRGIRAIWTNEFSQGSIILTAGSFVINLLNYLFSVLTAKSLGPAGFGEVSAVLSYVVITSIPLTVLSTLIIQKISAAGEGNRSYAVSLEHLFLEKMRIFSPLLIFLVALIPFLPRITNLSTVSSYSLIPLILLNIVSAFYISANQGLRLFLFVTIISIATVACKFLGALLTYLHVDGIETILIFLILSGIVSLFANYISFHRIVRETRDSFRRIERSIASIIWSKDFLMFGLSVVGMSLFGTVDIVFVKKFFSADIAGIYSSWSLFAKIILYAVGPLISVSFVFFSSKETKHQRMRILIVSLFALIVLGIASFFVYTNFGRILIEIFFGSRFNAITPYLGMASIFGSFYTAVFFINNYFLSQKHPGAFILPAGLPVYIFYLVKSGGTINAVMKISILFSVVLVACYMLLFLKKIVYHIGT